MTVIAYDPYASQVGRRVMDMGDSVRATAWEAWGRLGESESCRGR